MIEKKNGFESWRKRVKKLRAYGIKKDRIKESEGE